MAEQALESRPLVTRTETQVAIPEISPWFFISGHCRALWGKCPSLGLPGCWWPLCLQPCAQPAAAAFGGSGPRGLRSLTRGSSGLCLTQVQRPPCSGLYGPRAGEQGVPRICPREAACGVSWRAPRTHCQVGHLVQGRGEPRPPCWLVPGPASPACPPCSLFLTKLAPGLEPCGSHQDSFFKNDNP